MPNVTDIGFARARMRLVGRTVPSPDNSHAMDQVFQAVDEVTTGQLVINAISRALYKGRREIAMVKTGDTWDDLSAPVKTPCSTNWSRRRKRRLNALVPFEDAARSLFPRGCQCQKWQPCEFCVVATCGPDAVEVVA